MFKKRLKKIAARRRGKLGQYKGDLIKRLTKTEALMKSLLKKRFPHRIRFQRVIGYYIVDFIYVRKRLIIEIDGSSHDNKQEYDRKRDAWLTRHGFTVVRFTNSEVWNNFESVLNKIASYPDFKGAEGCLKAAERTVAAFEAHKYLSRNSESTVRIRRGRVIVNGKRLRPDCPLCGTGISSTWERCKGCQALIEFY